MDQVSPEAWFQNLPPITKWTTVIIFLFTLGWSVQLLNPVLFLFDAALVFEKFQIWRLFTNFVFIGKFSFGWVIHMYLWIQFSSQLERNSIFTSAGPGAYLWFIILVMILLNVLGLILFWPSGKPVLSGSLLFAVIYYWSRREMWAPITLYFVTVQGYLLPFAMMFLHLLMGAPLWEDLMGFVAGHTYYLFRDIFPAEGRWNLVSKSPRILDELMSRLNPAGATPVRRSSQSQPGTGDRTWFSNYSDLTRRRPQENQTHTRTFPGAGQRLGGN